jgi:hypothetical protein
VTAGTAITARLTIIANGCGMCAATSLMTGLAVCSTQNATTTWAATTLKSLGRRVAKCVNDQTASAAPPAKSNPLSTSVAKLAAGRLAATDAHVQRGHDDDQDNKDHVGH